MSGYALQLLEDKLGADSEIALLPPCNRVVYVVEGSTEITVGNQTHEFTPNSAWFGSGGCSVRGGSQGSHLWRWELVRTPTANNGITFGDDVTTQLKQCEEIDMESQVKYLMRCDRVDFPLAGVAYTHTHRGPGIRCLLKGEIRIQVNARESVIQPGESWFESGPEPVFAAASKTHLTSFVRAMILPRSLKGKSSITYVKPEDQDKPKTQQYTRFVDAFIEVLDVCT